MPTVRIKINPEGKLPEYQTEHASGADAFSAADAILEPGAVALVPTGLFLEIPQGYEVQVRPRSGLALKHGVTVLNAPGTIDADYRGEVKIILVNHGKAPFHIKKGDRIAQLVAHKVERMTFEKTEKLEDSARGHGGFGSTGK